MPPKPPLPPVLRHLTTPPLPTSAHASFASPRLCQLRPKAALPDGRVPGMFHNLFVTAKHKPDVRDDDLSETTTGKSCLVGKGGANFRVTDIAPMTKGKLHKTSSLDFLVVHRGTVTLHLDGGEKTSMKEGEAIIQRGTVHAWENESQTEWVRMFVVLLEADGVAEDEGH